MSRPSPTGPWARFRAFRSARPFWAGVFTIVAGGEILVFPLTPIAGLVQLGVGAISGVLFGVGLIVLGLFMWFSPPNRTLSGVLTLLIALASFVTSNLGGLVLGMVLGLIGGGLCLAWTPKAPPSRRRKRRFPWSRGPRNRPPGAPGPAEATQDLLQDDERGRPPDAAPRPGRRRALRPEELPPRPTEFRRSTRGRRMAGFGTVLAAAMVSATLATPGVAAAQECFLGVICSKPPPAEIAPTPTPAAPGARTGATGGSGDSSDEIPPVTPNPAPGGPLGELSDGLNGALGALPLPALPALTPAQIPLLGQLLPQLITPVLPTVAAQDGIVVSGLISNTTMDTLTVTNFRFVGVVTHQVAGGGTIRALRVIVDSTDIGNLGAILPGPQASKLLNQVAGSAHATSGQLILDFTKLKITVFGVLPLEFSFAFPPPPLITIPVLSGTDVDIDFVQLDTDPNIPGVALSIGPPSAGAQTTDTAQPVDGQTSLAGLVGLASALKLPNLLTSYGLTAPQAQQVVAAYEKDPAALSAASARQPAAPATATPGPTPTGTADPEGERSGAEGDEEPATPAPRPGA